MHTDSSVPNGPLPAEVQAPKIPTLAPTSSGLDPHVMAGLDPAIGYP